MTADEIREVHRARPFRPFTLCVVDGREYEVRHPELMIVTPRGRTVVVASPDEKVDIIDTLMITSIHMDDNGEGENTPSPE